MSVPIERREAKINNLLDFLSLLLLKIGALPKLSILIGLLFIYEKVFSGRPRQIDDFLRGKNLREPLFVHLFEARLRDDHGLAPD